MVVSRARWLVGLSAIALTFGIGQTAVAAPPPGTPSVAHVARSGAAGGWASLSAGAEHTCGIRMDGTAWCWGQDKNGQLGNDDPSGHRRKVPVQVGRDSDWASVSAGARHTCAIRTDTTAWCWGSNDEGQLGDGSNAIDSLVPVQVVGGAGWASISAGDAHTCGTRVDGTVWCWGYNHSGQLGDGTTTNSHVPVQVGVDTDWVAVDAGAYHSCGLRSDGSAWCWGDNESGQLGDGTTQDSDVPVEVVGGTGWTSLSVGGGHTCGMRAGGVAWCWGWNRSGQLGDHTRTDSDVPVKVHGGHRWTSLAAGYNQTCGTDTGQSLWCWGDDRYGELGDGRPRKHQTLPVHVGRGTDWTTLTAGDSHTCGTRGNGVAWCWGWNSNGELGDGTTTNRYTPVRVQGG